MSQYVALYSKVPWSQAEFVLDQGEWVILKNLNGFHGLWHRHDDKYGGGRNGPPYLARCGPTHCQDCPEPVPLETRGFLELVNWER